MSRDLSRTRKDWIWALWLFLSSPEKVHVVLLNLLQTTALRSQM
jgi:hypothetical protein